jgi:NADPH:quinone reductase-like Zn-dependent oxidoreductase
MTHTIANADLSGKIPDNISFEQAATIPSCFATALVGLYRILGGISPFSNNVKTVEEAPVIIWGASGSVGLFAVQLAKLYGLTVIATASKPNHEYIRSLGADHVFDYKDPDVIDKIIQVAGGKVNYAFDAVTTSDSTDLLVQAVQEGGNIITVLNFEHSKYRQFTIGLTFAGATYNVNKEIRMLTTID